MVNDQQPRLFPEAKGFNLADVHPGMAVKYDGQLGKLRHPACKPLVFFFLQRSAEHEPSRRTAAQIAYQTGGAVLRGHLKRGIDNPRPSFGGVQCDLQGKGGFADSGPCADDM